ncbi:MAG: VOC family protein [Aquamicrobium sp.]|nr:MULTISPECIES: VOC family protein [Mesorhizobium]MBR2688333.1 VOC family protein [Aquamicrobium sp.]QAZ44366.1 drug:proton antiporter [Mesorhizobium sp. Pch-S]
MQSPNFVILFVDQPQVSGVFYQALFNRTPVESSPTFVLFVLDNGFKLGLWSRHTALPAPAAAGGGSEIVFQLDAPEAVDATHADWAGRGLSILQTPTDLDFGRTFVALDPDQHRLRVYWLNDAENAQP